MHTVCATACRGPVLIFGEPGLQKDRVAALVHFDGPQRKRPMVRLDAERLDVAGADLFGRGDKPGLLALLEQQGGGTLLLHNVHKVCSAVFPTGFSTYGVG